MAEIMHTGEQWAELLNAHILDLDGWRPSNPYGPCDFYRDLITREDFDRRYLVCTVDVTRYRPPGFFNFDF